MGRRELATGKWASFATRFVQDRNRLVARHVESTFSAKFTQQRGVNAQGNGYHGLSWGAASLRGWCARNDDTFTAGQPAGLPNHAVFGVFDGHGKKGGDRAAQLVAKTLHRFIYASHCPSKDDMPDENKIIDSFEEMDSYLKRWSSANSGADFSYAGTCAALVIVGETDITIANLGDSQIACKHGALSRVHTCDDPSEANRVIANGGFLCEEHRINGRLMPSRALGDFCLKYGPSKDRLVLTCRPEITRVARKDVGEFVVIGSDGVFDVLSHDEVMHFCEENRRFSSRQIAELLVDKSLARGSQDNVTCVVIRLSDPLRRASSMTASLAEGLDRFMSQSSH